MGKVKDITGQRFGKLTVIKYIGKDKNNTSLWLCKCDCGNFTKVLKTNLSNNHTKSCGCLRKENTLSAKHGKCHDNLYKIYYGIIKRCYNKNDQAFKNYGARGIVVCQEWLDDFMNFYNWAIDNNYRDGLSIDRIDNDGNYGPSNCKWSTPKQQARNRRSNKNYTINGETHCLKEWCEILELKYETAHARINQLHWSIEKALELEE